MSLKSQSSALPNDLPGLWNEVKKCRDRYNYQGAAEALERAHQLEPDNDKILADLGSVYAKGYDYAAAERCFEDAIRISTKRTEALIAVGHSWLEVRNYEAARNCFETILQQNDVPIMVLVRLAEIYIRLRSLDDAAEMVDRAKKLYGTHEVTLLIRAKLHRELRQDAEAEKLLRMIVFKPGYVAEVRANAWYELGSILDKQGDYDKAMEAIVEAKALMRLGAGPALKILPLKQSSMKAMTTGMTQGMVQRWRKSAATELQPTRKLALLCGHARSGTTLLEFILDAHPGVITAEETMVFHNVAYYPLGRAKSPNTSFISAVDWLAPRVIRQIRADYFRGMESLLGQPIGDRLLMDKNPANTFDLPSVARIFPESKFVVALRDPRDVCLSCFMQPWPILPDTSAWLSLEGTIQHYALIMGLWVAWKPFLSDAAIEVRYEDVVGNLEGTARRTLDFLGLPWDGRVLRFNEHASTKIVRSPTYAEVTKPIYKGAMGRWKNYEKYFAPYLEKLAPCLKAFGYE